MAEFPTYEQMAKNVAEKALDEFFYDGKSIREWMKIIVEQEPKTEWIPFSERLPKPFEHCLITTTDGEVIYHYDDGQYSKYKAWMPLPEPYKAESEE